VVGRTRFCIHPRDKMPAIPVVGGTKQVSWEKVHGLKPDLIILDKEENTVEMAAASPYPYLATQVYHLHDVSRELYSLAEALHNSALIALADRWSELGKQPDLLFTVDHIPGLLQWVKPLQQTQLIQQVAYLIWRDPWMSVSRHCFIGSVMQKLGMSLPYFVSHQRYPVFEFTELDPSSTLLLLSSEPYPFHRKTPEVENLPFASAVVDGECYSWFGVRSLRFLEQQYDSSLILFD